jgi:hypothetical protein
MPAARRVTHEEREQTTLRDLEKYFPNFAGQSLAWSSVPADSDPPDFISQGAGGPIGLELTEWLDGDQMTAAKRRESQRDQVHRVLAKGWETEYQPENLSGAFLLIGNERISHEDEAPLRKEFYACAEEVDRTWLTNPDRSGRVFMRREFPDYPLMQKYFHVRYFGGKPHGLCWIHSQGDGGAYDPGASVQALTSALDKKLNDYSTPETQAHLKTHSLAELHLLVHGGFNRYAYNTPMEPLSLDQIAEGGRSFYETHPMRSMFTRVWFFHSLRSADDINQLIGIGAGTGSVRFLAQLWPDFHVFR